VSASAEGASARAAAARATPIPILYWPLWWATLAVALVFFYGILTPLWMLVRLAAWVSERPLFRRR
jgi:hypothetical protein